ncbi:ataxin-2 homolog, partial [Drosophila tropicalis]|uniref:ataxin-2 homolog n=1 Tax=Drosophila tropicalis TaxID=46794 RepID=UPI0035ABC1A3
VEPIASTKLTPSVLEETKGKTEKRDSSDQTDSVYAIKPSKDGPFRPIYGSPSSSSSSSYPYEGESAPVFQPTTVRYTAAEAAPQSYYEKPENGGGGGIRYTPVLPTALPTTGGEQHQHHHHRIGVPGTPHRFSFAAPPQVELYQRPAVNYVDPNPEFPPGQRFQYIIAIPMSHMKKFEQQLLERQSQYKSTSTTSTTTSTPAPPSTTALSRQPIIQQFGPLARDHQGLYRPYYQADAASAPPTAITQPPQQQILQIPASLLLAAVQQLQQQQHQQQSQQQSLYAKPSAATVYQPLVYQQHSAPTPQLQQLQRVYQPAAIYNDHPSGASLYAYTQQQQQQQQQQQRIKQQHKYTPAAPSVATPTPTATIAVSTRQPAAAALAAHHQQQQQQQHQQHQQQQLLPIVHYNPIYVQAPPIEQQHQFAISPRFSNNIPKAAYNLAHESTPPIQVVRLSAANAPPVHHYHHYQAMPGPMQQQFYHAPQQYVSPYVEGATPAVAGAGPGPATGAVSAAASPAIIPYFSHPGAVHYGTHLYHPLATATAITATSSPRQQTSTATATATSGGHLPGGSKAALLPAAANIVKYP